MRLDFLYNHSKTSSQNLYLIIYLLVGVSTDRNNQSFTYRLVSHRPKYLFLSWCLTTSVRNIL